MITACANFQCYGASVLSVSNGIELLSISLIYLGASTVVLMLLSFYLSYVLPSEYGVRKNPFFPIIGKTYSIINTIMFIMLIVALYKGVMYLIHAGGIKKKSVNRLGIAERGKVSYMYF